MSVDVAGLQPALRSRSDPGGGKATLAVSAAILGVVALILLFPSLVTTHAPETTDVANALQPPGVAHVFGTDQIGRDVYTRVIFGARVSLAIALLAVGIGVGGGIALGLLSAISGPRADGALMRVVDVLLAFPELLLALLVVAILGGGSLNVSLAIGIAAIPHYGRLVRSQALSVVRSEYVEAARVLGIRRTRYLIRHVLPNVAGPVVVLGSIGVGQAIIAAAGLSVLGLGPPPPTPEWGAMLSDGKDFLATAWWISAFPGAAVVVVVMSVTLLARSLHTRGVL